MYEDGIKTKASRTETDGRLSAVELVLKTHVEEIIAIKSDIKEMFSFLREKLGGDLPFRSSEKEATVEDEIHISDELKSGDIGKSDLGKSSSSKRDSGIHPMFEECKNPNAIPRFIQTEEFSTVVSNLSQIIFCGASTNIHESCTDLSQVIIPNLSIEEQRLYVIENLRNQKKFCYY